MAPGLALLPSGIFRYPENRFAGGIADQPKAFSVEVIQVWSRPSGNRGLLVGSNQLFINSVISSTAICVKKEVDDPVL